MFKLFAIKQRLATQDFVQFFEEHYACLEPLWQDKTKEVIFPKCFRWIQWIGTKSKNGTVTSDSVKPKVKKYLFSSSYVLLEIIANYYRRLGLEFDCN